MHEKWKAITGFPGYEVSNQGRVKSLARAVKSKCNSVRHTTERILRPSNNGGSGKLGYLTVSLSNPAEHKKSRKYVHRLVLAAFRGDRPKLEVNHIDAIKTNNTLPNLEWATMLENRQHAVRLCLLPRGMDNANTKVTDAQVREIRASTDSLPKISAAFGISKSQCSRIRLRTRRIWVD